MSTDQIETVHVSLPFYRHRLRQKALDANAPCRDRNPRPGVCVYRARTIALTSSGTAPRTIASATIGWSDRAGSPDFRIGAASLAFGDKEVSSRSRRLALHSCWHGHRGAVRRDRGVRIAPVSAKNVRTPHVRRGPTRRR